MTRLPDAPVAALDQMTRRSSAPLVALGVGVGIGVGLVGRLLVRPLRWAYQAGVALATPRGRKSAREIWRKCEGVPLPERVRITLDWPRELHFD